jgi:hypothetical protein
MRILPKRGKAREISPSNDGPKTAFDGLKWFKQSKDKLGRIDNDPN